METVLTDGFDIPVLEDYWAAGASEELYGGRYCRVDSQWSAARGVWRTCDRFHYF